MKSQYKLRTYRKRTNESSFPCFAARYLRMFKYKIKKIEHVNVTEEFDGHIIVSPITFYSELLDSYRYLFLVSSRHFYFYEHNI